jgi:hypothetical protein
MRRWPATCGAASVPTWPSATASSTSAMRCWLACRPRPVRCSIGCCRSHAPWFQGQGLTRNTGC